MGEMLGATVTVVEGEISVTCGGILWALDLPVEVKVRMAQGKRRATCCSETALRKAAREFEDVAKGMREHADVLAESKAEKRGR